MSNFCGIHLEGCGDCFFDEAFFQADAKITRKQLDDGFAFDGM